MQTYRIRIALLLPALILAFVAAAAAQAQPTPAAIVNGETIAETELNKAAAANLAKLDTMRFASEAAFNRAKLEILHKTLNAMIESKLIAAEAAKRGQKVDELIYVEIESNVGKPSDESLVEFYEANKAQIPIPREQALPQLREYLMEQQRSQYRNMLLRALTKTYGVKVLIEPLRTEVATAGFPTHGPANAPITIVEFADFECPHCRNMFPIMKDVEKAYGDKVRVVYRQFPLTHIHPNAQKASEASLCANAQQRFWEFHESLFLNGELSIAALKKRAVDLKLDTTAFNTCLDSGAQAAAVAKDIEDGDKAGVGGTPTLFINGRLYTGGTDAVELRALIEDELQRLAKKP